MNIHTGSISTAALLSSLVRPSLVGERCAKDCVSVSASLCVMASLMGCAGEPARSLPVSEALSFTEPESSAQVSVRTSSSDEVILGPGESIAVSGALRNTTHYMCSTGYELVCDRINNRLFCICPGAR